MRSWVKDENNINKIPKPNLVDAIKVVKEQIPYLTDNLLNELGVKVDEEIKKRENEKWYIKCFGDVSKPSGRR